VDKENRAVILNTKVARTFAFDYVFDANSTQEEIFDEFGRALVQQVCLGYHGSVYCFGQTGAGKTYTMQGPGEIQMRKCEDWGLMPRMIDNIFLSTTNEKRLFRISYLEIYKETITDLLDPDNAGLQIREDFKRGVFVERLSEVTVWSVKEAMAVVRRGIQNRHIAATLMNERSSRSHAVFTFTVKTQVTDHGVTATKEGKLNLIDLAGSERCNSENAFRMREAGAINRSLSVLTWVILQLSQRRGSSQHINFRDSKLTFLLRESLGGNSKTVVCANISSLASCFSETISTLKFAQRAKTVRTNAVLNEDFSGNVESLTYEVKVLRAQLETLNKKVLPADPAIEQKLKEVEMVNTFLKNSLQEGRIYQSFTSSLHPPALARGIV